MKHTPQMTRRPSLDILIVSSYYWPEAAGNAPYVTGVAEHLVERGHRVVVATGFPHYPEWRASPEGVLGIREQRAGVEIRRRRHYVPRTQSVLTRALYEASLLASGTTAVLNGRAPDAIIGISPTLAAVVLASAAARFYRRPYGLIFQDLQGPGAAQSGVEGGRAISRFVERTEVRLARQAAAVGVIADGFRTYFEDHGLDGERIHDLRNWSQDAAATETLEEARARLGWSASDFVCLHAGNMGHKQGLENVLEAAALLDEADIRIVLAGDGNERPKLESLAGHLRLQNVSFVPPQPSGRYESMLRAADVLLVNQRSTVGEMSLASKLTSYFMTGRPVIGAVAERSETARELQRAQAGVLIAADDPDALATAIRWVKANIADAETLGESGRVYAERHLSPTAALERYEQFVETVSRAAPPRSVPLLPANGRPWLVADPAPRLIEARSPAPQAETKAALVSVAIVSYQCRDALERCLRSLQRDRDVQFDVIVVDNASEDGTVQAVTERFPWVRLIANQTNVGFAQATNQALDIATGDYVLLLNPDTLVPRGGITRAVAELERHSDVGMLGCKLVRPDGTFDHACKRGFPTVSSSLYYFFRLNRVWPRSARFAQYTAGHVAESETGYVDAVNGAFMLVKREAAEDVGPMDERYWLYAEDLDWCHAFWERGWKILYWPEVEVVHWKGGSAGDVRSWALDRAFHRSMWLFYEKHHARRHSAATSALVWTGVWAKFAFSVLTSGLRKRPRHDWNDGGSGRLASTPDVRRSE